jgi:hypothetical protein
MPRTVVGLLAAVGAAMSALAAFAHGDLVWTTIADAAAATGLAAYLALPAKKELRITKCLRTELLSICTSPDTGYALAAPLGLRPAPVQPDRCQWVCRGWARSRGACALPQGTRPEEAP